MHSLQPGARNAVRVCMGITASDVVSMVTDLTTEEVGRALETECLETGARAQVFILDDFASRPATGYPDRLRDAIDDLNPTASFFAASALLGELAFRRPFMEHVIYTKKVRHGHMPGVTRRLMLEGMAADYEEIYKITHKVNDAVVSARQIEVTTARGTDLRASFDPSRRRWTPCDGRYHDPGRWGNLPEGETFTSPMTVDGVMVAEVLGDHFSEKYGVLPSTLKVEIAEARVRKVICDDEVLRRELEEYLGQHENSNRVGEYAIGTNIALKELSGNLLQDEKMPGVHVAFGYPYPEETGADWTCPSHLDIVATRSTIKVDGQFLMREGQFVI